MTNKEIEDLDEDLEKEDEDESQEEGESEGKHKREDDSAGDDSPGEDSESEEISPELKALRERRKREKKMKRERERRERFEQQNTIVSLQNQLKETNELVKKLSNDHSGQQAHQIESEMREVQSIYQEAQQKMKEAVTSNDGDTFVKAKEISDKAWVRFNSLDAAKRSRQTTQQTEQSRESAKQTSGVKLTATGIKHGQAWAQNNSWYKADATGQPLNLDSTIVQLLDKELYNEGYDPESREYWDELTDRAKERIPHRYKAQGSTTKPRVITGGGGGNAGENSNTSVEKNLPKNFVDNLKSAGYWDNPAKKKAAIADYMKNKKAKV